MPEQETRKRSERIGEQYFRLGIPVISTEETIAEVKKLGFLTAEETLLNTVLELEAENSRLKGENENLRAYARYERDLGAESFAIENLDLQQQVARLTQERDDLREALEASLDELERGSSAKLLDVIRDAHEALARTPVADVWSCTHCTTWNPPTYVVCQACKREKPTVAEPQVDEDEAEIEAAESDIAEFYAEPQKCTVPPAGWRCTREAGHDGPCAAVPVAPQAEKCNCQYHPGTSAYGNGGWIIDASKCSIHNSLTQADPVREKDYGICDCPDPQLCNEQCAWSTWSTRFQKPSEGRQADPVREEREKWEEQTTASISLAPRSIGRCPQCLGDCESSLAVVLNSGYLGCPRCRQVLSFANNSSVVSTAGIIAARSQKPEEGR